MNPKILKKLEIVALILATFFNPLGFDALFALVMRFTGSYWVTDGIFYCTSLLFFGLYFFLVKNNKKHELLSGKEK